MLESKNMDTIVFILIIFIVLRVTVGNIAVTRKREHRQRPSMCLFVCYIVVLENYSGQSSLRGRGFYSELNV